MLIPKSFLPVLLNIPVCLRSSKNDGTSPTSQKAETLRVWHSRRVQREQLPIRQILSLRHLRHPALPFQRQQPTGHVNASQRRGVRFGEQAHLRNLWPQRDQHNRRFCWQGHSALQRRLQLERQQGSVLPRTMDKNQQPEQFSCCWSAWSNQGHHTQDLVVCFEDRRPRISGRLASLPSQVPGRSHQ